MKMGFPSYALAIIILNSINKDSAVSLSFKQAKSMKNMQKMPARLQKIQKKYKNDKEKLNKASMELYQKYNVNPAAGCLPLLSTNANFICTI
jgi:YidC/Oxa1 family membrane protein insertase